MTYYNFAIHSLFSNAAVIIVYYNILTLSTTILNHIHILNYINSSKYKQIDVIHVNKDKLIFKKIIR